ncbi:MAG: universal stress protein [Alphaproteobacteria bacterium]|nr:universal stress protein [Alphaproteobacteria bacterium]
MTMRTILIPIEEGDGLASMLETGLLAAGLFGSYIEGLYYQPTSAGAMVVAGEGLVVTTPELVESVERQDRERRERVRSQFNNFMERKGISLVDANTTDVTGAVAAWVEEESPNSEIVGTRSRVFDLTVVSRPVRGSNIAAMSILEAALFEGGRPILIAPPEAPTKMGDNIVIAWNGSTETARTIAFSMPFLVKASQVAVIAIDGFGVAGPSSAEVARQLQRNGIPATNKDCPAHDRRPGRAFLEEAADLGADLLVKGAYTQSRVRQMIFGGATDHILSNAELPVLMSH